MQATTVQTYAHNTYWFGLGHPLPPEGLRRTPKGEPEIGDLLEPGTVISTSYGSGPYIVLDTKRHEFTAPDGTIWPHWSLCMTDANRPKKKADAWINDLVAVAGKIVHLFGNNADEVIINQAVEQAPQIDADEAPTIAAGDRVLVKWLTKAASWGTVKRINERGNLTVELDGCASGPLSFGPSAVLEHQPCQERKAETAQNVQPSYKVFSSENSYVYEFESAPVFNQRPVILGDGSAMVPGDCFTKIVGKNKSAGFRHLHLKDGHIVFAGRFKDGDAEALLFSYSEEPDELVYFGGRIVSKKPLRLVFATPANSARVIETTIVERVLIEAERAGAAPTPPLASRVKSERKAKARRCALRKRLEKRAPLFADLFEAQEVAQRSNYFDPAAIEAGTDMAPAPGQAAPQSKGKYGLRPSRHPGRFEQLSLLALLEEPKATANKPSNDGMTTAAYLRAVSIGTGTTLFPSDFGLPPFEVAALARRPMAAPLHQSR